MVEVNCIPMKIFIVREARTFTIVAKYLDTLYKNINS